MKKCLTGFHLKIIAITLMVIDHIGAVIFPQVLILRIIGRLSFPLFAFCISEGYRHTRSVKKYLTRLGLCAVLFQIPDWLSTLYARITNNPFFGVHYVLNIFATLFFGLAAITLFDRLKSKGQWLSWLAVLSAAVVAEVVGADYGAYGVLYMVMFYITGSELPRMLVGVTLLHGAYAGYEMITGYLVNGHAAFPSSLQLYSMLSVFLIAMYNHEPGRKMKFFFYAFYPLHMIVIYLISYLIR